MTALVEEAPVIPSSREESRPERSLERRRERERERSPHARDPREERAGRDNRRDRIDERFDRRDRDRDYKRRKSLSPGYRDRRQSPSKRYDDSHDRGGRGPYSRGVGRGPNQGPNFGGRGFSGSDFMRVGWWNVGRGSGFDIAPGGHNPGNDRMGDMLLSYKQFMLELDDDVSPTDALAKRRYTTLLLREANIKESENIRVQSVKKYEEYKTNFIQMQKKGFFVMHKAEEWLREKYDPIRLEPLLLKRKEHAHAVAKEFGESLQSGRLNLGASAAPRQDEDEEDGDGDARRRRGGDRRGKEREEEAGPKVPKSAASAERVEVDLKQALALVKKLDGEKGVAGNVFTENEEEGGGARVSISLRGKVLEGVDLLDVALTYLWRVHGVDYYGANEAVNVPKGVRTLRASKEEEERGNKAGGGGGGCGRKRWTGCGQRD